MCDHVAAELYLALVVWRRVDRDDQVGSHRNDLVGRIVLVKPLAPERFVVPEIFADHHTKFCAVNVKYAAPVAGLKVSRIVENVVFGKKCFVGKAEQLAIVYDSGAIEQSAAIRVIIWPHGSDDRSNTACLRHY